ncbi:Exosome complex component RRP43 [Camellia lanceoleosa]|uniref:Exosome complex component RRP43 n=1 Tax=Camellia lanceoleosa TaxID=1840588 RepID=A0ACC0GBY5_9ERIC|nr:Exosome complex component RRP43 [Camellia lanceoleosa]
MSSANASGDLSSEMEVDAFRRLFPLRFHERHLLESVRPDARKLGKARDTTLALVFCVVLLSWTLKYFVFVQTMLAAIKMEVMTPTTESPDKGCKVIDFHMPPICSPIVWPDRPADAAPVILKHSGMINFKELSLVSGKAAWMAYLRERGRGREREDLELVRAAQDIRVGPENEGATGQPEDDRVFDEGFDFYEEFDCYTNERTVRFKIFRLDRSEQKWWEGREHQQQESSGPASEDQFGQANRQEHRH